MMDRPAGNELLAEARRLLLDELLTLLPADRRYDARMIANAMAIAARELEMGSEPAEAALRDLALLYGEPILAGCPAAEVEPRLMELNRRLVADIRSGRLDTENPYRRAVWDYLRTTTLARLRISNPKALADCTARQPD